MSRLARNGTTGLVSRDQILSRERGQGNIYFPCSADHEQDWQHCTVDPYSATSDHHTNNSIVFLEFKLILVLCLKKNQTTPRPSEHPPVMGGKMSKLLLHM